MIRPKTLFFGRFRRVDRLHEVLFNASEPVCRNAVEDASDTFVNATAEASDEVAQEGPQQTPRPEGNPHVNVFFVLAGERAGSFQIVSLLLPANDELGRDSGIVRKIVLHAELLFALVVDSSLATTVEEEPCDAENGSDAQVHDGPHDEPPRIIENCGEDWDITEKLNQTERDERHKRRQESPGVFDTRKEDNVDNDDERPKPNALEHEQHPPRMRVHTASRKKV